MGAVVCTLPKYQLPRRQQRRPAAAVLTSTLPPQYVKPFVKRNKTDGADAEAICEAAGRPTMRFVAIKSAEQQSILALHRARDLLVRQRTKLIQALRGYLGEFGLVAPKGG
jgi:transposase